MISKTISIDILKYLQEDEKLSVEEIAAAMGTDVDHINEIIKRKKHFTAADLESYLKSSGLHFWEFAIKAIPLNHLPEKAKDRVLFCKQLSDQIKKKK